MRFTPDPFDPKGSGNAREQKAESAKAWYARNKQKLPKWEPKPPAASRPDKAPQRK
jgi:hypothetical protein